MPSSPLPMHLQHHTLDVRTPGRGFTEITRAAQDLTRNSGLRQGLATVFVRHTSASLLITENADPQVRLDLERWLQDLVPDGDPRLEHTAEGPDDMPAHIRSALTATSLSIPLIDGRLALGTWQGLYLWEHRYAPHRRTVLLTLIGQ